MARKRLSGVENEFEGKLFGIVTQLRDYQLCWHLNKTLNLDMQMMDDIEITNKKKQKTAVYSWFRCEIEIDKQIVYLISNKHSGDFFLPEIKQADYILAVRGEINDEQGETMIASIRKIEPVQLVIELDYNKLKSKENLVLE